ncbi:MAG: hypothetical protein NW214_03900 [Pseudanabaenaceae cyanobacterium bins.39]|nr:hypothetical protein [Pseudanabaenaceae cyanobacterium bins.39]
MQTLSPTISPTIPKSNSSAHPSYGASISDLPAIAQSTTLQTSLAGLDANLNDELDRYRHWQQNGQTISYLNPFRPRAVSAQSIWTSPNLSEALNVSSANEVREEIASPQMRAAIQMPVMPPLSNVKISHNINNPDLAVNTASSERSAYEQVKPIEYAEAEVAESYAHKPSPTMAAVPPLDDEDILQNFANDYAESFGDSSQNFDEPQGSVTSYPSRPNALQSLMSPVGIISLLLLLCSSVAIGYLLVDPTSVMKLLKPENTPKSSAENINPANPASKEQNNVSVAPVAPFTGDASLPLSVNNSPSLTGKTTATKNEDAKANGKIGNSFLSSGITSNNASNLGTNPFSNSFITPNRPSSTSSSLRTVPPVSLPSSAPPIAVAPLPPAPVYREPAPQPRSVSPAPRATAPSSRAVSTPVRVNTASTDNSPSAPRPSVTSSVKYAAPLSANPSPVTVSAVAPSSIPSNNTSYRVVVDSNYAASAQQVDRNAFIRPSDGKVQIGSYRDANAAQQQIEDLRRQGIPARIE